jgi:hypothetical protein
MKRRLVALAFIVSVFLFSFTFLVYADTAENPAVITAEQWTAAEEYVQVGTINANTIIMQINSSGLNLTDRSFTMVFCEGDNPGEVGVTVDGVILSFFDSDDALCWSLAIIFENTTEWASTGGAGIENPQSNITLFLVGYTISVYIENVLIDFEGFGNIVNIGVPVFPYLQNIFIISYGELQTGNTYLAYSQTNESFTTDAFDDTFTYHPDGVSYLMISIDGAVNIDYPAGLNYTLALIPTVTGDYTPENRTYYCYNTNSTWPQSTLLYPYPMMNNTDLNLVPVTGNYRLYLSREVNGSWIDCADYIDLNLEIYQAVDNDATNLAIVVATTVVVFVACLLLLSVRYLRKAPKHA